MDPFHHLFVQPRREIRKIVAVVERGANIVRHEHVDACERKQPPVLGIEAIKLFVSEL